jgi:hypothetical protein
MIITWEVLYIFQLLLLAEKKGRIFKVIFFYKYNYLMRGRGRGECTLILFYIFFDSGGGSGGPPPESNLFYIFFFIQEKRRENLYMHIEFS